MDFRGAVLRGWRLLVLLGLVGAVAGYFSVPTRPAVNTAKPAYYVASTIIAPTIGKGSVSLGQLFLYIKSPQVLGIAAANANVGVPATQLLGQVGVVNGRAALGLGKKGNRGIGVKALGV